ncbi:MAG: LptF/LptG family permease [Paludibacteraceae bacterium]|nr:LptF/LptG family permease [Paludibacteraceae bacterium]
MILTKILHRYILRNFLRTFLITFSVSIFVLVMQFMFHYADDFIGKGMGLGPIAELFFHAALSLVPLSLPLSILLGSLMTFGNLGEKLELLSMKAAGVSLFRIMMPLIIVVGGMSVGSFFFADKVLPKAQVRMWTLIFSVREKSLELNIPEGSFYSGIEGLNIYVREKKDGMLNDVVIYDYSQGFSNTLIILADKGKMEMSKDKTYLLLTLYNGESFENMKEGDEAGKNDSGDSNEIIPYRRETFSRKEIIIDFDSNFNEMSSSFLEGQYVSKNTRQLQRSIDSISARVDSLKSANAVKQVNSVYFDSQSGSTGATRMEENDVIKYRTESLSKIYNQLDSVQKTRVLENAIARCNTVSNDINYDAAVSDWMDGELRRHAIEWHKKFTLAFACFIFLFIGAPLGAIIRKGGMGMPIVISTVMFIVYYIIDNTGYKMAREGLWPVWQGMWLSAEILLPLGIFLTYLAATDNTFVRGEAYLMKVKDLFNKIKNIFYVQAKHNRRGNSRL